MVAMRVRNHVTEEPPSLYYSTVAGVSLNHKYPGTASGEENPDWSEDADWTKNPDDYPPHVIVASEPSTRVAEAPKVEDTGPWKLIAKNTCVMVEQGVPKVEDMNYHPKFLSQKVTLYSLMRRVSTMVYVTAAEDQPLLDLGGTFSFYGLRCIDLKS